MNRALKNAKRKVGAMTQKSEGTPRPGNDVTRRTGTERPDASTANPGDMADPVARVIRTNS